MYTSKFEILGIEFLRKNPKIVHDPSFQSAIRVINTNHISKFKGQKNIIVSDGPSSGYRWQVYSQRIFIRKKFANNSMQIM